MNGDQGFDYTIAHVHPAEPLTAAFELLISLQSKLDVLKAGSGETGRLSRELQLTIDQIRQALSNAPAV